MREDGLPDSLLLCLWLNGMELPLAQWHGVMPLAQWYGVMPLA